jgi:alpha-1,3-glucan synthase
MEYDIEDLEIKIKIGGLGVMAQLMGKNLGHQDLIWVVPCVGGVEYPQCEPAPPMKVTIMDVEYEVNVQYHKLRNITYVLLDAPVFRQQTKSEPYPARMDDMTSAIYYSAWNQCIAQAITRFPIDLYHINDYHGTIAPLYLLPRSIPACLSLHNAEFQGLWPMRTKRERDEVCKVFNLSWEVVSSYVQFGEIFNLVSTVRIAEMGSTPWHGTSLTGE